MIKKIDNNYKHSTRARAAAAQIIVDEIVNASLLPAQDKKLYDMVFEGLEHGLSPEQIFKCAQDSMNPSEYIPLMMRLSGVRWSE